MTPSKSPKRAPRDNGAWLPDSPPSSLHKSSRRPNGEQYKGGVRDDLGGLSATNIQWPRCNLPFRLVGSQSWTCIADITGHGYHLRNLAMEPPIAGPDYASSCAQWTHGASGEW
jgi:hypothetical protein